MRRRPRQTVQRGPRLEAQRNRMLPRQVDDLLKPGPTRAFGYQYPLQRAARAQRFSDGVNPCQNHSSGFNSRPLLKRFVKLAIAATSVISTIGAELKYSISASRESAASAVRVSSREY